MIHKLLQRQVERLIRRSPDGVLPIEKLLEVVSATYEEADTERRRKERSMKLMSDELLGLNTQIREESKQYVSLIIDNVVDGIVTFDADGIIHSFNGPMAQMFHLSSQEAIGQHISILTPEKADENDFWKIYLRKRQRSADTIVIETIAIDQQGREFPIDLSISEMQGANATLHLAIIRDISRRKEVEHALISAKERAEEASLAKASFLSTMSHEIRTPMNAVIGLTNLLLQQEPRPDQLENLKVLKFSGENLLVLINDILDFNKIEAGKLDIESIDFSLSEVVNSVREALNVRAMEKQIYLKFDLAHDLPKRVNGDSVRLAQILNNLVGNAVKFTEKGGVTLEVLPASQTETHITLDFHVTDTGIGIPEDKIDHIFESFNQSDSSITRKYGGTGLGLAITRRLLELQGGSMKVTSIPEQGSRFSFQLSFGICDQAEPVPKELPVFSAQELAGCKILLVEDNLINQMVAKKFLTNWGLIVDIADNGKIALDLINQYDYDAVLMDLQMPEMDGYTTTKHIRSHADTRIRQLPIIALTASAMHPIQEQVKTAGMDDFVAKPFQPDDLRSKISRQIHQKQIVVNR